jgi:uncharacterized protein YjbJ (UPF0337 family)/ElaB/YqjD/DUF883 family membrane-anchored ribosome-binding protein
MNQDILQGKLKALQGRIKERWGKLTSDDILRIDGKYNELVGVVQERYGYTRDNAVAEVNAFIENTQAWGDEASERVQEVLAQAQESWETGKARAAQYQQEFVQKLPEQPVQVVKEHPWLLLLTILLVGVIIGILLRDEE